MQLKPIAAITVLLLVVVSLSIAGCTSSTTNSASPSPSPADVNVTATTVQSPQQFSNNTLTPRAGDKYVQYNATFTNINAPSTQISDWYSFQLLDSSKNVYSVEQLIQQKYLTTTFPSGYTVTQPGDKVSGNLIYEVPQNATIVALRYSNYLSSSNKFNVTVPLTT